MNRRQKKAKKNTIVLVFTILSVIIQLVGFQKDVLATNGPPKEDKNAVVGFTVEPILTSTQVDETKSYYYIKVNPNEPQTLTLKIRSTIEEERKVKISVKDAFTNQNGNIDYDAKSYVRDKTLKDSLEDASIVEPKEIAVKNFEEKEVTVTIKPPKEPFEGVKIAAICVTKVNDEDKTKGLSTSFGYRLGLMTTEENEPEYANSKSLNFLNVKPTVHQGKRVIQTTLQNPEPKILKNLTVETKLREKGSNEVLRKRTTNDMRMAPNSQFDFATNWGLDPIRPGTYVLSVKASSGEHSWSWNKEFTIGEEQAQKINEEASYTITYPKWVPLVVILLGVLTICTIGALYVRRKKWTSPK